LGEGRRENGRREKEGGENGRKGLNNDPGGKTVRPEVFKRVSLSKRTFQGGGKMGRGPNARGHSNKSKQEFWARNKWGAKKKVCW